MLIILVLALLFCPSLAEEELRDVKQKSMLPAAGRGMLYFKIASFTIHDSKKKGKARSISTKDPHPSSIALGPLSRS